MNEGRKGRAGTKGVCAYDWYFGIMVSKDVCIRIEGSIAFQDAFTLKLIYFYLLFSLRL